MNPPAARQRKQPAQPEAVATDKPGAQPVTQAGAGQLSPALGLCRSSFREHFTRRGNLRVILWLVQVMQMCIDDKHMSQGTVTEQPESVHGLMPVHAHGLLSIIQWPWVNTYTPPNSPRKPNAKCWWAGPPAEAWGCRKFPHLSQKVPNACLSDSPRG